MSYVTFVFGVWNEIKCNIADVLYFFGTAKHGFSYKTKSYICKHNKISTFVCGKVEINFDIIYDLILKILCEYL